MSTRRTLRRRLLFVAALPALLGIVPLSAADACGGTLCAGAASVDLRWHTGSGQGQLGSPGLDDKFDPFHHATKLAASDGTHSPGYAKAVVVQGADGTKIAYVKTEVYLQPDLLSRRVGQLVAGEDPANPEYAVDGLAPSHLMLGGTHNHSAPHYVSTAAGVWAFADAFDLRQFELLARRIALAVKRADEALVPAKVGASVTRVHDVQQNILGPAVADDGSPAGFPRDWFDPELSVVRFDRADGQGPIAAIVNLGMHPESLNGSDFISADFVGAVERDVERALGRPVEAAEHTSAQGPVVAWSQGGLGDVEPDQSRAAPTSAGHEYWRRDYAQMERMSRVLADAVVDTWRDVAAGTPDVPAKFVPLSTDAPVAASDLHFAGPAAHPLPTASNCRTERPGVPVVGLPDCERPGNPPEGYGATLRTLREAGVPVPEQYGAPSYKAVQESTTIRLQVLRVGEVLLAACPCEPVTDMVVNFKSRADQAEGTYRGYEWPCREADGGVECDFRHAAFQPADWRPVSRTAFDRMRAQVRNPADGWEQDPAQAGGEAEPADPAAIKGNFSSTELDALSGYRLPLMVGQANDYVGYVVTYREYQRGDHYRKALTPFGPRTADYVNSRLVAMAGALKGGPAVSGAVPDPRVALDDALQRATTAAVGAAGTGGLAAYEAAIPDDGGSPELTAQPADSVPRFAAATVSWTGGSNWTDQPEVVVERLHTGQGGPPGGWRTVATREGGEIVTVLAYESHASSAPLDWLRGGKTYGWTAVWETREDTVPGRYRFTIRGHHRSGRQPVAYQLRSQPFTVTEWQGLKVAGLVADADSASFEVLGVEAEVPPAQWVGPIAPLPAGQVRYPFRNTASVPYLSGSTVERGPFRYCWRCTFRPWASHGRVVTAAVTVQRAQGPDTVHPAVWEGGRWVARGLALGAGDTVRVEPGQIRDEYGNTNT